jgi:S1-C subfamily serine protease
MPTALTVSLPTALSCVLLLLAGPALAGDEAPDSTETVPEDKDASPPDSPEEADPAPEGAPASDAAEDTPTAPTPEEAPPSADATAPADDPTATEPHDTGPPALSDSVVILAVPGRTFAGVLVEDGEYIATLLELVRVGFQVRVGLADGSQTRARLIARDPDMGLALLRLDAPADPRYARSPSSSPVEVGQELTVIGHGGASQVPSWLPELGEMISFSQLSAKVAAVGPEVEDEGLYPAFLIDRTPGEGDLGAPVFDDDGGLVGLVADTVEDGGDRTVVVGSAALEALLQVPRADTPKPRQSHFQSWGGAGLAVHNDPLHFAGSLIVGARVAIIDQVRLEPWFELLLGARAPIAEPEATPQTFWWSLETGINLGYRLNIFNPRSRDYIVPNAGFRIGWNKFDHWDESLVADCSTGECRWVESAELVREDSLRPGIDIGLDVQKGPVRIGYRFFIAPADIDANAMHRIFITFDGFPLPIRFGDSH